MAERTVARTPAGVWPPRRRRRRTGRPRRRCGRARPWRCGGRGSMPLGSALRCAHRAGRRHPLHLAVRALRRRSHAARAAAVRTAGPAAGWRERARRSNPAARRRPVVDDRVAAIIDDRAPGDDVPARSPGVDVPADPAGRVPPWAPSSGARKYRWRPPLGVATVHVADSVSPCRRARSSRTSAPPRAPGHSAGGAHRVGRTSRSTTTSPAGPVAMATLSCGCAAPPRDDRSGSTVARRPSSSARPAAACGRAGAGTPANRGRRPPARRRAGRCASRRHRQDARRAAVGVARPIAGAPAAVRAAAARLVRVVRVALVERIPALGTRQLAPGLLDAGRRPAPATRLGLPRPPVSRPSLRSSAVARAAAPGSRQPLAERPGGRDDVAGPQLAALDPGPEVVGHDLVRRAVGRGGLDPCPAPHEDRMEPQPDRPLVGLDVGEPALARPRPGRASRRRPPGRSRDRVSRLMSSSGASGHRRRSATAHHRAGHHHSPPSVEATRLRAGGARTGDRTHRLVGGGHRWIGVQSPCRCAGRRRAGAHRRRSTTVASMPTGSPASCPQRAGDVDDGCRRTRRSADRGGRQRAVQRATTPRGRGGAHRRPPRVRAWAMASRTSRALASSRRTNSSASGMPVSRRPVRRRGAGCGPRWTRAVPAGKSRPRSQSIQATGAVPSWSYSTQASRKSVRASRLRCSQRSWRLPRWRTSRRQRPAEARRAEAVDSVA